MEAPGEDLSPALALGQEANAPSLGGWRDVAAIATHAPARPARIEALIKLAERRDPAALEPLLKAATDHDWVTRKYAMSGLGILARPLPTAPLEGREPLADETQASYGRRDPQADGRTAAALVAGLGDPHVEVRRAAARALKPLDDGSHEAAWLSAAADPDHLVRAAALAGLGSYEGPAVDAALWTALVDPAWLARFTALQVLAPRPGATPALLGVLQRDASLSLHAGRALGPRAAAEPGLLEALVAALPGATPWQRLALAAALGLADAPAAREALAGLVGHPDAELEEAILAQGPPMVPLLRAALADPTWTRRWHAVQLLGKLGVTEPGLVRDPRPEVQLAALEALAAHPSAEALPALEAAAGDPSWRVRAAVARAAVALGATDLCRRLASDGRPEVSQAAGQGGPPPPS